MTTFLKDVLLQTKVSVKSVKVFSSKEAANSALPLNQPRKVIISGKSYCFVRTPSGIYAVDDACPHQKTSLSGGFVNAFDEIICPLHEYRFSLKDGSESSLRSHDVEILRVEIHDDGVFVNV